MKYKDLPKEITINKLISTSFNSPSVNRKVFNWCNQVLLPIKFLESERVKLVHKYGTVDKESGNITVPNSKIKDFSKDFAEVMEMDIQDKISDFPLEESSFEDENCEYPKTKELWLSPAEIGHLLDLMKNK